MSCLQGDVLEETQRLGVAEMWLGGCDEMGCV